jgi:hypothetical protein
MVACLQALRLIVHAIAKNFSLDRTSNMRILCRDGIELPVSDVAVSRSPLLLDVHTLDPEGCAELPCDSRTWEAWVANEPTLIKDVKLLHDVVAVSAACFLIRMK